MFSVPAVHYYYSHEAIILFDEIYIYMPILAGSLFHPQKKLWPMLDRGLIETKIKREMDRKRE